MMPVVKCICLLRMRPAIVEGIMPVKKKSTGCTYSEARAMVVIYWWWTLWKYGYINGWCNSLWIKWFARSSQIIQNKMLAPKCYQSGRSSTEKEYWSSKLVVQAKRVMILGKTTKLLKARFNKVLESKDLHSTSLPLTFQGQGSFIILYFSINGNSRWCRMYIDRLTTITNNRCQRITNVAQY